MVMRFGRITKWNLQKETEETEVVVWFSSVASVIAYLPTSGEVPTRFALRASPSPSPQPSPQGEGESSAVSQPNPSARTGRIVECPLSFFTGIGTMNRPPPPPPRPPPPPPGGGGRVGRG